MRLSIIVPFYNMESELGFTMDALLGQTLSPADYEIIAVDDSSPDGTFNVLKGYEERYPGRVRALRTPQNLRQGGARNLGMSQARGEWTGFMDGDDFPHPEMFEKLLGRGEETGADVVGCHWCEVDSYSFDIGIIRNANSVDQTGLLGPEQYRRLVLNPGSMVTKIYRTDVIKNNRLTFPEGFFYEDNAAAPNWMLHFRHFELVEEPLYYYYQQAASTTHTVTIERCRDRMRAGELMIEWAGQYGFLDDYRPEFEASFTKLYYVNTLYSYLIGCRRREAAFLGELRDGILRYFPEFRSNPYYDGICDAEQKRQIDMHQKSPGGFLVYYSLLSLYRKMVYRK